LALSRALPLTHNDLRRAAARLATARYIRSETEIMAVVHDVQLALNRLKGYANVAGIKLPVDRRIVSPRIERSMARQTYESSEGRAVRKLIQAGDTVLEIGAGIGYISSLIRRFTPAGRIVSIEANPELVDHIRRTHGLNCIENVEVRSAVVMSKRREPTQRFYCREEFWAGSLSPTPEPVTKSVEVEVLGFDDLIAEIRPQVVVMDIEGGEYDLFTIPDLGTVERVVVEVHVDAADRGPMNQLLGNFARLGLAYSPDLSSGSVMTLHRVSAGTSVRM